jgi:hypothetical protein
MRKQLIGALIGLAFCCFGQGCPRPQEAQPDGQGGGTETPSDNPCLRTFYSQTYGFAFDPPLLSTGPVYETPGQTTDLAFKYEARGYTTAMIDVHKPITPSPSLQEWREVYLSSLASQDLITNDTFVILGSGAEAWWLVRHSAADNTYIEHLYVRCGPRIMYFAVFYGSYLSDAEVADLRRAMFSLCVDE